MAPRSGLINGTTATVEHVDHHGLAVRLDGGATAVLRGSFVQGTRRDGTPNVSHGWARTVDGAQGGTWESCHLLGSSALDAFRGYSGQSRSRQPTHTWNTATIAVVDHGGVLADRRTATEVVVAALGRQPDTRLAARSDPFIIDRQLFGHIHAHEAVLAGQPPDRAADLAVAEQELAAARARQTHLESVAAGTADRLNGLGARSVLSAFGRGERRRWQTKLAADRDAVEEAKAARIDITSTVERLRREQTLHECFERIHGWRRTEISQLQDRLDHHWAEVIAACIRADDPLAYGIDRLRHARATVAGDLDDLNATIPVDREAERGETRRQLAVVSLQRRDHERDLADAEAVAEQAARRRWGRRDQTAIGTAGQDVDRQRQHLQQSVAAQSDLKQRFSQLVEHQYHRGEVLAETYPRRVKLSDALSEIDGALDRTRPERVQALTEHGPITSSTCSAHPPTTPPTGPCGNTWPTSSKPISINNYPHRPGKPSARTSEKPENSSPTKPSQPTHHVRHSNRHPAASQHKKPSPCTDKPSNSTCTPKRPQAAPHPTSGSDGPRSGDRGRGTFVSGQNCRARMRPNALRGMAAPAVRLAGHPMARVRQATCSWSKTSGRTPLVVSGESHNVAPDSRVHRRHPGGGTGPDRWDSSLRHPREQPGDRRAGSASPGTCGRQAASPRRKTRASAPGQLRPQQPTGVRHCPPGRRHHHRSDQVAEPAQAKWPVGSPPPDRSGLTRDSRRGRCSSTPRTAMKSTGQAAPILDNCGGAATSPVADDEGSARVGSQAYPLT